MDDHLGVILLMDKNPAPVEGKVVHPIIYDGFYTSKRWLALGFLNHQQY